MDHSINDLRLIWKNQFPPDKHRDWSLLEKLICTVTVVLGLFSLSNVKTPLRRRFPVLHHLFMDLYVLAWLVVLTYLLFSGYKCPWLIVVLVAAYRIVDIVNYRVLFLFLKSETKPWTAGVIRRSVAVALVNFFETVMAFAIIYLRTGTIVEGNSGTVLNSPTNALYFSLTTMTTVGFGDFVAKGRAGHWLVMSEICSAIVFILFLLPALMSVFSPELAAKARD
jgi:Ion channel